MMSHVLVLSRSLSPVLRWEVGLGLGHPYDGNVCADGDAGKTFLTGAAPLRTFVFSLHLKTSFKKKSLRGHVQLGCCIAFPDRYPMPGHDFGTVVIHGMCQCLLDSFREKPQG